MRRTRLVIGGLLVVTCLAVALAFALQRAVRQPPQQLIYPGATLVSSHQRTRLWPLRLRQDLTLYASDPFPAVYQWYSLRFQLGTERHGNAGCINLSGSQPSAFTERTISVNLCQMQDRQLIQVTQFVNLMP